MIRITDDAMLNGATPMFLSRSSVVGPDVGPEHVVDEPGRPVLEVTLQLAKVRGPSYLYTIDLELRETVVPVRELKSLVELDAVTWKRKTAGIANRGDTILEAMDRMADDFATEYQREN